MSEWYGSLNVEDVFIENKDGYVWYAVRTKSRTEKKLSLDLFDLRIRYYLPLYKKMSKNHGRVIERQMPLFTGYLFVYADYDTRMKVVDNKNSATLYEVTDTDLFIKEIRNIEKALQNARVITPVSKFQVGEKVRVKKGSMEGIEGEVIQIKNSFLLQLKASFLGQGIQLEIDGGDVEVIAGVKNTKQKKIKV